MNTRFRTVLSTFAATSAVLYFAALPSQAATTVRSTTPALPAGYHLAAHPVDSAAVRAALAAHHGVLTTAQLAALGLTPNTIYQNTPQTRAFAAGLHELGTDTRPAAATPVRTPAAVVRPNSASGCNDDVCIEVTGSGLEVTKWYSLAMADDIGEICGTPVFWVDDEVDMEGTEICGDYLEAWDDEEEEFENNTQLCNSWSPVPGFPCEIVHD